MIFQVWKWFSFEASEEEKTEIELEKLSEEIMKNVLIWNCSN
jgi:phosphoribosylformylglycinamidine (FGAM) synthase PurS component